MSSAFSKFFAKFKWFDALIFCAFAVVTVFSFFGAYGGGGAGPELLITTRQGNYAYDLATDRTLEIEGDLGVSIIEIKDGVARFLDSPCPNKTCVMSLPLGQPGDFSACLPNQVFARIVSDESGAADVMAR